MTLRGSPTAAWVLAAGLVLSACGSPTQTSATKSDDGNQASASSGATTSASATFTNPVADVGNDPYVIAHEGSYYLVESRTGGALWVTRSATGNLTDIFWSGTSVKVWEPPLAGPACRDVWAPELHPIEGRWYIYFAATTCDGDNAQHRMFALESEGPDPQGRYLDRGQVTDDTNLWAIDGTTFVEDGQRYFVWSGWAGETDGQQNLYIAPMSDPATISGPRVMISEPTLPWETSGMPVQEGPQVLRHGDRAFIVYSASGSWTDDYAYGLLALRDGPVLDPASWTKSPEPAFAKTDRVFGPGHGTFVLSPDGTQDWMIYHAARASGSGWDRVVQMQPFTWTADGTPDFGSPVAAGVELAVPSGQ